VVLFRAITLSNSKTTNDKVVSFLNPYTKRSHQKSLQFWRVVNSLKNMGVRRKGKRDTCPPGNWD